MKKMTFSDDARKKAVKGMNIAMANGLNVKSFADENMPTDEELMGLDMLPDLEVDVTAEAKEPMVEVPSIQVIKDDLQSIMDSEDEAITEEDKKMAEEIMVKVEEIENAIDKIKELKAKIVVVAPEGEMPTEEVVV